MTSDENLRRRLDSMLELYCGEQYVQNDPLGEVMKFTIPADREAAAFVAAGFAFGNIKSILAHLRKIWHVTGPEIADFTKQHIYNAQTAAFNGLKYRWITPRATSALFHVLGKILANYGSIEEFFKIKQNQNYTESLQSFCESALVFTPPGLNEPDLRGMKYFFTLPLSGSACKRLNLFLRWVVRKEPPDLGIWSCITPSDLVIPLDVHVARVAASLGLTSRKTRDWKMAVEITEALRAIDPEDPLKYDFALHKLGVTRKY
jgi:uncharacterized protein (TIGR02757 family)